MTCAEYKELVAAHALGALDEDERRLAETHEAHPDCREALARAKETVDALGDSLTPVRPPPAVWAKIEAQLEAKTSSARARGSSLGAWIFAAAAILVLLIIAYRWREDRGKLKAKLAKNEQAFAVLERKQTDLVAARDTCERTLAETRSKLDLKLQALALLEMPDTRVAPLQNMSDAPMAGHAVVNMKMGRGVLVGTGFTPKEGLDYELWVIRGDQKLPAGVWHGDTGSTLVDLDPELLAGGADAIAVTHEPKGGGPVPRGPVVMMVTLSKT